MAERRAPGIVRDAILHALIDRGGEATVSEIAELVRRQIGDVPASSVRSYLALNTPRQFRRTAKGRYKMTARP